MVVVVAGIHGCGTVTVAERDCAPMGMMMSLLGPQDASVVAVAV
jgi:hypothetical protein